MLVVDHMHQLGVMHRYMSPGLHQLLQGLIALWEDAVITQAYARQEDATAAVLQSLPEHSPHCYLRFTPLHLLTVFWWSNSSIVRRRSYRRWHMQVLA